MSDYNNLVRLLVKLSGVALVVYGGVTLSSYLPSLMQAKTWAEWPASMMFANIFAIVMPILFGVFLWFFPAPVANTIVRSDIATKKPASSLGYEFERIGVALLGLFFLYHAVTDMIYQVLLYRAKIVLLGSVREPDNFSAYLTVATIKIVLALLLLLQSNGVVALLRKVRGH